MALNQYKKSFSHESKKSVVNLLFDKSESLLKQGLFFCIKLDSAFTKSIFSLEKVAKIEKMPKIHFENVDFRRFLN